MLPLLLNGHTRPLTCVQFSPDGDLIFTCGKDGICAVWRTDDGKRIGAYKCGKAAVWGCDVTLDSQRLAVASAAQKIFVFDVVSGDLLHEIDETGPVKFVEWNRKPTEQNKIVILNDKFNAESTKAIKCWAVDEDRPIRLWVQDDYAAKGIQVHWGPYDETIVSVHENGDIMIWNAETGEYIREFRGHKQSITCMSLSMDRLLALTCCSDGTAKLWDTVEWELIKQYTCDRPLNSCGISPRYDRKADERRMHLLFGGGQAAEDVTTTASGEGKFEALLFHMVYQEELGSIKGHFGPLNTLAWMPDGNGYVSGGEDGYVRVYNFDNDYFTKKFD